MVPDPNYLDTILTIASAVIRNDNDEILLLKREGTKTFQGCWQLPEGKLEENEKPQDALRREIREELGVDVDTSELKNVNLNTL